MASAYRGLTVVINHFHCPNEAANASITSIMPDMILILQAKDMMAAAISLQRVAEGKPAVMRTYDYIAKYKYIKGYRFAFFEDDNEPDYLGCFASRVWFGIP